MNKKGAEFTVSTLVVIVLAILVLVVLALGFGTGWTNLWSKITGYFSPVNVDAVKQACTFACTTQSTYAYCCQIRDVKLSKDATAEPMTCSNSIIKPADCDLSCNVKQDCGDLVCYEATSTSDVTNKLKVCAKDKCPIGKEVKNRVFKDNGDILKNEVCCSDACIA